MREKAFTTVDLLVSVLATIAVFMLCMTAFNHIRFKTKDGNKQTLRQHIDSQMTEIEDARRQATEFEKDALENY